MQILKQAMSIIFGFSSGVVISGAVFAFISIVGIIPKLAQKTRTTKYVKLYEECIIFGGISGTLAPIFELSFNIGRVGVIVLAFCSGIFTGCLAMCLAEILDVIPVLTRRIRLAKGMAFFVLAIATGKFVASLAYFVTDSFS